MRLHFALILALTAATASAQTGHTITQGAGYADDVFFSLNDGIVDVVPGTNWDLAFDVSGPFSATVRVNDGHGRLVSVWPDGAIGDWAAVTDTTGFSEWPRLNNGITAWEQGALNASASGDPSDFSWGIYTGPPLHQVVGDSIYLLQRPDASTFKFRIDNLDSGVWNLTYAAFDGGPEMTASFDMADYAGKNFVYFDFDNGVVDREPLAADWDFVFTRYVGETLYGLFPTTGVLLNKLRPAAEAAETPVGDASLTDVNLNVDDISVIGNDWKSLVNFEWQLAEDLSYFVESGSGSVCQIWFTAFEGSSTGVTSFNVLPVSGMSISTNDAPVAQWSVFPNPIGSGALNIQGTAAVREAMIFDNFGRLVNREILNGRTTLATDGLASGRYHLQLVGDSGIEHHAILKQ